MPSSWLAVLTSRWLTVGLVLLIIFVGVSMGREYARQASLNRQIDNLKQEVSEIEGKNQELTELISYLDTQKFSEEEARVNMGLQKPGEQAIVLTDPTSSTGVVVAPVETATNWRKWWWYFFDHQRLKTVSPAPAFNSLSTN